MHQAIECKLPRPAIACRFDALGRYVFAGAEDNLVRRWDLASGKVVPLAGHETWVRAMTTTPDGRTLITGGYEGRVIWWPAADEQPAPIRSVQAHQGWVRSVAVSPDGKLLATGGNDNRVKLWNAADGTLLRELSGHQRHVYHVLFHPAGQALVSCDLMGVVKHWDTTSLTVVREFTVDALHKYDTNFRADIGGARGMAFSTDAKLLGISGISRVANAFAGVGFPEVVTFDWESGKQKQEHRTKETLQGVACGIAYQRDGYWIAASGGNGGSFLFFWKPDEPQEFLKFKLPDTVHDMHMHPDGLQLAVAMQSGHVRIYSLTPAAAPKPKA